MSFASLWKAWRFVLGFVLAAFALLGSGAQAEENLSKVRLQLKWQHQFQFAGYYAAQAQGYYREAGLDVDIIPGLPGEDTVQKVLHGEAEFGVGTTDLILLREQGLPVVVLAVIFQHSPLALLVRKQAGLQSLHELAGRRLMIEPGSAELHAYLRREGLTQDRFTLLPHAFHIDDLVRGRIDAMSVYVTDEPYELVKSGIEYLLYSPRSVGIDFYGDNLFTTADELAKHPDRAKAFRAASLKGWEYAMQHPEEMVRLIHDHYSARHSLEHLRFEAQQMVPLLQMALVELGHINPGRWAHIAEVYAEQGMMKRHVDLTGFLYNPHPPPPDLTWLYWTLSGVFAIALLVAAIAAHIFRINRRLQISEERYRVVYETAPLAFIVSDQNGLITDWNSSARLMFGWSREQAIGRNMLELLVADDEHENVHNVLAATLRDGTPTYLINRNLTRSGDIILCEWHNVVRLGDDGAVVGVLSLGEEITERKKLEDDLRQAKEVAEQAVEEQRQFLAMVSHELRSPLAVIDSAAQGLALKAAEDTAVHPVVLRIRRAVKRLSTFIDNCLTEDRLDTSGWSLFSQSIEIEPFLQGVLDLARQGAPRHHLELQIDKTSAALPKIFHGDPQLLRIMLQNLLENAVKYSPEGSAVTLRVSNDGESLSLSVSDCGIGIAESEQGRIFNKYVRGNQVGRVTGAGLGLFLVHRIATLHGGRVEVDSQPGSGSTFRVRFPLAPLANADTAL